MCQSLYARVIAATNSVSSFFTKNWPPMPGHDGKLSDASTPLTFMSRMRSCTSYVPGRTWSKLAGSLPQFSRGRPCTALSPKVAISWPSISQASVPSSRRITLGTRSLNFAGHVVLQVVGQRRRLDDVVVDADEDEVFRAHP